MSSSLYNSMGRQAQNPIVGSFSSLWARCRAKTRRR